VSSRPLARVSAGLAVLFAALTGVVVAADGVPGDSEVLVRFASSDVLSPVARVVDRSTGYLPVGLGTALLVLVLRGAGRHRDSVLTAVSVTGAVLGTVLLKRLVGRPRPELLPALADVSPFSYPSGHVAGTAALAAALVLSTRGSRPHRPVVLAASLLVVVAAAAQLVLARHHPSDLLGGVLWSGACTTAAWAAVGSAPPRGRRQP
jgi:undecaprenyl-diphosphatase